MSTTAQTPLPLDHAARPRTRILPWLILWTLVAIAQAVLLWNNAALDTFLWRTTRWLTGDQNAYRWADYKARFETDADAPFYYRSDPPWTRTRTLTLPDGTKQSVVEARLYNRSERIWRVLRDLGEPVTTGLIIAIVWIYDPRRWKAAVLVLYVTLVTGIASWLLRAVAGRNRPVLNDGENVWALFRGFGDASNLSWPSGHATLAFATAAVLVHLSPKGKGLFLFIAAGCAWARVVMHAHFYSDVILGSALGWTVGWFAARMGDRFLQSPPKSVAA